ncbi:MAG: exosome complex RNA-binding protein Csl4 [Thermoplasmata archaeon]|nr:exosome complex RNA-binding protein Csl4 [Thermoplasmata archaeon]
MKASESRRVVVPGDLLGTAEEFVPGRGTYEHEGRIFAALLGHSSVDSSSRSVSVHALHAVPELNEGDLVIGRVDELKSAMAIVDVLAAYPSNRTVPGAPEGTIHVSKVKDGYAENLADELASGDLVLARILQSRPSIKLTTAPPSLGVVLARCQRCHGSMELSSSRKDLVCPRCGNQERRKISTEYGGRPASSPG